MWGRGVITTAGRGGQVFKVHGGDVARRRGAVARWSRGGEHGYYPVLIVLLYGYYPALSTLFSNFIKKVCKPLWRNVLRGRIVCGCVDVGGRYILYNKWRKKLFVWCTKNVLGIWGCKVKVNFKFCVNCIYPVYTASERKLPPGNYICIPYTRIGICKCRRKRAEPRQDGPAAVAICHRGYIPSNCNPLFPDGAGGWFTLPRTRPAAATVYCSSSDFILSIFEIE